MRCPQPHLRARVVHELAPQAIELRVPIVLRLLRRRSARAARGALRPHESRQTACLEQRLRAGEAVRGLSRRLALGTLAMLGRTAGSPSRSGFHAR